MEWKQIEAIYVFDGDILKAFDYLKPSMVSKMLREMHVPASLRAAWINE